MLNLKVYNGLYTFSEEMEGNLLGKISIHFFTKEEDIEGLGNINPLDISYYLNRAVVSYVFVNPSYRRIGIGKLLYLESSKYFNEKGYKLYSSDNLLEGGKYMWHSLLRDHKDIVKKSEKAIVRVGNLEYYSYEDWETYYIWRS